jgi:hypothetical protein
MSMIEDEQRIALSEWMGWTRKWKDNQWIVCRPDGICDYCDPDPGANWELHRLPDTNSLDVLHGFEMKLTQDQQITYTVELWRVVNGVLPAIGSAPYLGHFASATAAQRREALCRVLGLHKDSKP